MSDDFDYLDYIKKQTHHDSDWKQERYLKSLVKPDGDSAGKKGQDGDDRGPFTMALFGLGRIGFIHLTNILINRRINLKYIVEENESIWEPTRKKLNLKGVTFLKSKDSDKIFQDRSVETILVATPTPTHEKFITAGLKAGMAVFSEKPISNTRESIQRVYNLASELKLPLFCGFQRRFDPSMSSVYQRVRAGEVGKILQVKLTARDSPSPPISYVETSGGVYVDSIIHDIDMMMHMMAELPIQVFSNASSVIPEIGAVGDFDNLITTFKFKSGAVAVIDNCRVCPYGYDQRAEVFGTKGMLQVQNETPDQTVQYQGKGISRPPVMHSFVSRYEQAYFNEIEHFLDVVQGKQEMLVTKKMVLAVAKIVVACNESSRSQQPINITWTRDELPYM